MCCEEEFLRKLRERGYRLTLQREMVLHILHEAPDHPTAEEVFSRVSAVSSAVDLSTVYRTLELLQALDLVTSFELGDGQRRYELLTVHHPHHHLLCRGCGKLLKVDAAELQPLVDALRGSQGFVAQLEHMVIPGLCRECARDAGQTAGAARQAA